MSEYTTAKVDLAASVKWLLAPGPSATLGITAHGVLPHPPPGDMQNLGFAWLNGYKAAIADVLKHLDAMPGQPEYRAAMEIYKGGKL